VRAAAPGTVVAVHDGQPDNVAIGSVDKWDGPKKENPMSSYGNYVLIDHGSGEFTLYGHMRNGSVLAKLRDQVRAGQDIGAIGNSGASGGVHLHWERRRGRGFGLADIETQPAFVHDVELVGSRSHKSDTALAIDTGDVLIAR
ncbi:MAG: M23 family metallopeptidase, partial [Pseudomonadota bacterium]|nr:M23 family metallopeptidase [Pseudomonadota bacterium]